MTLSQGLVIFSPISTKYLHGSSFNCLQIPCTRERVVQVSSSGLWKVC